MKKALPIFIIVIAIAAFWVVLSRFLTLEEAKRIAREMSFYTEKNPVLVFAALAFFQFAGMLLSLPTKAIITVLTGALLGPFVGSIATVIGVIGGTTALFFTARYFLRDWFKRQLGEKFKPVEERLNRHPIRALMGLRMFITLPYGPITLTAALSSIRYRDFLIGSLLGDLPAIIAYNIGGRQLFSLTQMSEAISPWTVAAFVSVGLFFIVAAFLGKKRKGEPSDGL
jgi:phospholipase D1/2